MKQFIFSCMAIVMVASIVCISSCKKDKTTEPSGLCAIEGKWKATSDLQDGIEYMPLIISAHTLDMNTCANGKGNFIWESTLLGGFEISTNGTFTVTKDSLVLKSPVYESIGYLYKLDSNKLTLEHTTDTSYQLIKFDKL